MILVFGLGNPGHKYSLTRHNIGFLALDYLVSHYGLKPISNQFNSLYTQAEVSIHNIPQHIIFTKPQTYMNNSGKAAYAFCQFYKIQPEKVIAIHDDIDLTFGDVRAKAKGGTAGHHGIESIVEHLGTDQFKRIRIGIGRPSDPSIDVINYVLSPFNKEEQNQLPQLYDQALKVFEKIVAGLD